MLNNKWVNEKAGSPAFLARLKNIISDLIFPIECLSCGKPGSWLCDYCLSSLVNPNYFYCPACDKTTLFGRTHLECMANSHLDGLLYASSYKNETIQKLIHIYKYKFVKDLSLRLAKLMAIFLKNVQKNIVPPSILKTGLDPYHLAIIKRIPEFLLPDHAPALPAVVSQRETKAGPTLIPIPLHQRRLRERGFNQSQLLASELSKVLSWPMLTNAIRRKRYTTAQMSLKSEARKQNISNAFECAGPNLIQQKNIILIDDVFTTGSTMQEAARILKQAGAKEVWAFCLAKD